MENIYMKLAIDTSQVEESLQEVITQINTISNMQGDKAVSSLTGICESLRGIYEVSAGKQIYDLVVWAGDFSDALGNVGKIAENTSSFFGGLSGVLGNVGGSFGGVGLAIAGVTTVVGLFALAISSTRDEAKLLEEGQLALATHLEGVGSRLTNTRTQFDILSDEVLPKLKESYLDVQRTFAEQSLGINTDGLDGLGEKMDGTFQIVTEGISGHTAILYDTLKEFFMESNGMIDEHEEAILNSVLDGGNTRQTIVSDHYAKILEIQTTANSENRDLTKQEFNTMLEHYEAIAAIPYEIMEPAQAEQLLQMELFIDKKGNLSEEEKTKALEISDEYHAIELEKLYAQQGTVYAALKQAKDLGYISENDYQESIITLKNDTKDKEEALMTEKFERDIQMLTGYTVESIAQHENYDEEITELCKNNKDMYGEWTSKKKKLRAEECTRLKMDLDIDKESLTKFNDYLDTQPKEYSGIYKGMRDEMNLKEGIDNLEWYVPVTNKTGEDIAHGIGDGVDVGTAYATKKMLILSMSMKSTVNDYFDIASPSKVMRKLMRWVPIGGALGIEDEQDTLVDAMTDTVSDIIETTSNLTTEMSKIGNGAIDSLMNPFSDTIGQYLQDIDSIPGLPVNGIVNIPQASLPYQNTMQASNDNNEMKDILKQLMLSSNSTNDNETTNLYIDGELLFKWFRKKKRSYEFVTNGGEF